MPETTKYGNVERGGDVISLVCVELLSGTTGALLRDMKTTTNRALRQTQEMTALTTDQLRAMSVSIERRRVFRELEASLDDVLIESMEQAVRL